MTTHEPPPGHGTPHAGPEQAPAALTGPQADTPLEPHEDPYGQALSPASGPLFLRRCDGGWLASEVDRWCAAADEADMTVLRRCVGAVLDVGCGPGRLVAALREAGHPVLGIDVSRAAVARTQEAGGAALCRSVFDALPGERTWDCALLLDGNIGIGGDPVALLERLAGLVAPSGGLLFVEADPCEVDERMAVRFDDGCGRTGRPFPWARVGAAALRRMARVTGWTPTDQWSVGGRHFLTLRRPG
ncbi:class I SAM-dependent methyltransferase [Streptomyces sp. NPDC059740]|uniref:class I SAM-dependent methyltransferase n=1 Tax=Streptomyces sp. NPDC059740 TaxID=3346926 RepID=UPI0036541E21